MFFTTQKKNAAIKKSATLKGRTRMMRTREMIAMKMREKERVNELFTNKLGTYRTYYVKQL